MKQPGIYMIQSIIKPERIYIGSAVSISSRWRQHLNRLSRGVHHSLKLQRHYNKYGINDLIFTILKECSKEELIRYEQSYIDTLNPYFNGCKIAGSTLGYKHTEQFKQKCRENKIGNKNCLGREITEEHRLNLSTSHLGNTSRLGKGLGYIPWNKGLRGVSKAWNKTAVFQYDLNMLFIKEWESTVDVENTLGINNIAGCLTGKRKTAGGFIWKRKILI